MGNVTIFERTTGNKENLMHVHKMCALELHGGCLIGYCQFHQARTMTREGHVENLIAQACQKSFGF